MCLYLLRWLPQLGRWAPVSNPSRAHTYSAEAFGAVESGATISVCASDRVLLVVVQLHYCRRQLLLEAGIGFRAALPAH
jgi:hypothetical protein